MISSSSEKSLESLVSNLNRSQKRKLVKDCERELKKVRGKIKSNRRGNRYVTQHAKKAGPREDIITEAEVISDRKIIEMINKLDELCACDICHPCNSTKESSAHSDNCDPSPSCLRVQFTEDHRELTERLKSLVRSCRERLINKEKDEEQIELIKIFKATVTNEEEFINGDEAYDDNGLPRYDTALERQKKTFQHKWILPGNIEVCGNVFKFVHGITQYKWDKCSTNLKINFDAVKLSHRPYNDSTVHNITHAQVRDIYAYNVLDRDTNMPVGDTPGGSCVD